MKKAFLQLHLAIFLAGFTAILGNLIGLNEGWLVWYRMWLTALVLFLLIRFRGKNWRVPRRDLPELLITGIVIAFHWVMFYGSIKYGNISIAVVCLSASGLFSSLSEPLILKKQFEPVELILGILSISGILIIFDFHPQYKLGILLGVLSALGSAIFPILNKRLILRHRPETLTLYEMAGGGLLLTALLPLYPKIAPVPYILPTAADWGWMGILVLVCTVFCFDLQLNALKRISPFTVNLSYNLEPVYGIILAFVIFHENQHLNRYFYLGVFLILLSVVLQMFRVWMRSKNSPKPVY